MNTRDVVELYEITDAKNPPCKGVYVIGSLSSGERIAVSSQQARALNLVYSLFDQKILERGSRVCVIGGGAAGLTAAAYAIRREAVVTVLESHDLLWNLRGCRTRWLHPNLFRWWPLPRWKCTGTNFPVMNWYAGYASDIGELLHQKYLSFEALQNESALRKRVQFPGHQIARDIHVDRRDREWNVTWTILNDNNKVDVVRCDVFDVVIVATGFGSEARTRDTEASLYWLDDTLERERPTGRQMRYLISGTGDGGLTDLLRVRIKGFRHHHLRDCLLDLDLYTDELRAAIEGIEAKAREKKDKKEDFDITEAFRELTRGKDGKKYRLGRLLDSKREGTSVVLTNREGNALASPAWRVSKFLAAQLLEDDASCTSYRKGPAQWDPVCVPEAIPNQPPSHPERFYVRFALGAPSSEFDAVVVRHGPQWQRLEPQFHRDWGSDPVRAPCATLARLGFPHDAILHAEQKWERLALSGQVTDELVDADRMNVNLETRLRSRVHAVLPAVGGRTVIGMLSRLVSAVGPEEHEAPRHKRVDIDGPLVADDVAALLTQVAMRRTHRSGANGASSAADAEDGGWRLGSELNRKEAIEVIWAADRSLSGMWSQRPEDREFFERNWVLPRPPWSSKGPLLEHTCVARHWAPWRLSYLRDETAAAKRPPRQRHRREQLLRHHVLALGIPESPDENPVLTIVDCCALERRVAVFPEGSPRVWRLIRELGAEYVYIQKLDSLDPIVNNS